MVTITPNEYQDLLMYDLANGIQLQEHLGGFDANNNNTILSKLDEHARSNDKHYEITHHQILSDAIKQKYPSLKINFSPELQEKMNFLHLQSYRTHPELTFQNFLCSFNGSPHVSRKLLTSAIKKFKFWSDHCSKNFSCTAEVIDGHIQDYSHNRHNFYRKFFSTDSDFLQSIYSFDYQRADHLRSIHTLQSKLTASFLHLNSECLATSYAPFVSEKFTYSTVTRGLFLSYAQPGWHQHLEQYYGFKNYDKIFDYQFDSIQNPVERLIELMTMIAKFSVLSSNDWRDLYEIEHDTIEYNYDHYFSRNYIKQLQQFC